MKKVSAILIIISLLVSAFDIIDTSDILVNGKAAFSSTNELDQDAEDSINVKVVSSYNILIFNLVESQQDFIPTEKTIAFLSIIDQKLHQDFIQTINEPPIA
ncbi:MAG: hypothetical protein LBR70_05345 [Lactobacillaceae bacterium]|jgi:hypothetical protein|nr:hypothetical protein [Lactobacillaceae bacterium]